MARRHPQLRSWVTGHRGKPGVVVLMCKMAKVIKEVQQLVKDRQQDHDLQAERAAIESITVRV